MLIGQKITVIGAGIGGLACAVALSARGAAVRVIEQANELTEVGAGLQVSPNGVAVLDALRLADRLRAVSQRIGSVALRDYAEGANVLQLSMQKHARDLDYLVLHRADLIALLADAAAANGVEIQLGRTVSGIADEAIGATLHFSDYGDERVDLLIAADGLHSQLRGQLNREADPFFTGQVAWRALVSGQGDTAANVNLFMGPGRHLVTYPIRNGELINIVAVEERTKWADESWSTRGDANEMRAAFANFCPEVKTLLERVDTVNLWGLFRHPVARHWHGSRSVLLGDAAHPTLPFLAQGANLALEDAWVLADCLSTMQADKALTLYQNRRQARARKVIGAANANARNYHLRNPALRLAAHGLLRASGLLVPRRVVKQFDWIYRHDVTQPNG